MPRQQELWLWRRSRFDGTSWWRPFSKPSLSGSPTRKVGTLGSDTPSTIERAARQNETLKVASGWGSHVHPELSPPGRELTMLHVWFVPSPDGPFAGHNPWLPYFATGLELPDLSRLTDEADSYRIRALALALAETVSTPFSLDRFQERLPEWFNFPDLETHRDAIREQIPDLDEASRIGDLDGWNAAADRAVAEWEAIRSSYLATIPIPALRGRLSEVYDEMLAGAHEEHGSH